MTNSDPLAITLFGEIAMADQLARARLNKVLPKGMELSHFSVLNHLAHQGGEKSPAQLARLFHVTKGAMTNTLGKLERSGFIHIRPDWDDARRKHVRISPAGEAALETAIRAIEPVFDRILSSVGSEKIRMILPVLRDLRAVLEKGD